MTKDDQRPCPPPDPNPHPPKVGVPRGATDCHAHIFGPASKFPLQDNRSYTPPDLPLSQLRAMHRTLGVERLVLVHASVHGTDNSIILDALATDPLNLRAVAAMTEDTTDGELVRMRDAGVCGIRVNLVDRGGMPFRSLAALSRAADRIRDLGFHLELLVHVESFAELGQLAKTISVPMSVGHIGYTKVAAGGLGHPGFQNFLAMLRDGLFWVKLTGPYRISMRSKFPYDDVAGMAKAVIDAAPGRVIWGSDWPHVMVTSEMPNDGDLLDGLSGWVPDPVLRHQILVDNPARLYGFA
jgi:predicted TIM-barrel fold metal-dependent hydrolase